MYDEDNLGGTTTRKRRSATDLFRRPPRQEKPLAVMIPCPGVVNDGLYGHSMRDGCHSCAPFWEQYPTCPAHHTKLSRALHCRECKKFYAQPAELDLRIYE